MTDDYLLTIAYRAIRSLRIPQRSRDEYIGAAVAALIECRNATPVGQKRGEVRLYFCARDAVLEQLRDEGQTPDVPKVTTLAFDPPATEDATAAVDARDYLAANWHQLNEQERDVPHHRRGATSLGVG